MSLDDIATYTTAANTIHKNQYDPTTPVKHAIVQSTSNNNFSKFKSDMKKRNIFKFFTSNSNANNSKKSKGHARITIGNSLDINHPSGRHKTDYFLIEFCLKRPSNSTDFGFTIVGYCPCQIGRVDTNSIAYKAGLQYGDQIIKIDAENVSRATSESIVKLIKNSNECLIITVYRHQQTTPPSNSTTPPSAASNHTNNSNIIQIGKNITQGDNASMGIINSTENDFLLLSKSTGGGGCGTTTTTNSTKRICSMLFGSGINSHMDMTEASKQIESFKSEDFIYGGGNYMPTTQQRNHRQRPTTNSKQRTTNNPNKPKTKRNPNKYKLNKTNNSCRSLSTTSTASSLSSASRSSSIKSAHLPSPIPFLPPIKSTLQQLQLVSSSSSSGTTSQTTANTNSKIKSTLTDSDYKTQSSSTTDLGSSSNDNIKLTANNMNQLFQHDDFHVEEFDVDRMDACERLLNIEEKFIELMQKGVQQYSRPLRHCMMISGTQHHMLFQNIEKILAISEYQLNQLISQDDSNFMDVFNSIGKLYENKMRMSCEAFDIYLNGVDQAFTLLENLIRTINFSKFIQDSEDDINMDLRTFLILPLKYINSIYTCLELIRDKTKNKTNNDYLCNNNVLKNLFNYQRKALDILKRFANTTTSSNQSPLFNLIPNQQQQQQRPHTTPLSTSTQRFLIYSSKLYYSFNDTSTRKPTRAYTMLFNDILTFMSRQFDVDNHMDAYGDYVREYVSLKDISQVDYDLDMNEFQIKLNTNRVLTMRALSLEEKHTWKKLLIQRINQIKK